AAAVAVEQIYDRKAACVVEQIARGQIHRHVAIGGVALEIALEGLAVHGDAIDTSRGVARTGIAPLGAGDCRRADDEGRGTGDGCRRLYEHRTCGDSRTDLQVGAIDRPCDLANLRHLTAVVFADLRLDQRLQLTAHRRDEVRILGAVGRQVHR